MVEYNFDEAIELLNSNKNNALKSLERIETEMEFLKDQITTLEVSIQNPKPNKPNRNNKN
jgi:prefoldin subunit 5